MSLHPNLSAFCDGGCERKFEYGTNPDDKYLVESGEWAGWWIAGRGLATGNICDPNKDPPPKEPPPPECAVGQKRLPNGTCANQDDCPVGQHKVAGKCEPDGACPAGKIKGPDGSCVDEGCPAGQAKGKDGTCKKDDDGDGKPDDGEGDDGSFTGGDSCEQPPKCSGDAILCGSARIQWRIDCNTRKNRTVTGGACNAIPICTGEKCDALEYAQLLAQWRSACALEKLASASGGGTGTNGQPDWTKVTGDGSGGAGAEPTGVTRVIGQGIEGRLDSTGFLSGSSECPRLGTIDSQTFGSYDLDAMPWLCDILTVTRWILKLLGAFIALGILMGWRLG